MGYVVVMVSDGHIVVGRDRAVSLRFAERALERFNLAYPGEYLIQERSDVS